MRFEHPSLRQGLEAAYCPSLSRDGSLIRDRSGRNNHGTHTNVTPTVIGGRMAMGYTTTPLAFTDLGRNINVSAASGITYTAWVFGRAAQQVPIARMDYPIGPYESLYVYENGGLLQTTMGNGSSVININSSAMGSLQLANAWNHYAAVTARTASGSSTTFWANGVAFSTVDIAVNMDIIQPPNNFSWYVGFERYSGTNYGSSTSFDDIRVYRRALTAAEVRLLYSRRGIGLTPLPDRAAGLPRKLSVNVGGTWRAADAYVRTPTDWRLSDPKVNVGGVWK
jgi:hypothetical protein